MGAMRWAVKRLWVVPVGVTVWDLVVAVRPVDGRSMQPTLNPFQPGEVPSRNWVLLNRWSVWWGGRVRRGDIVTLTSPENPSVTLVKRVIGLQNDIVRTDGYKDRYLRVPEGHCWVEGDSPTHSKDSNSYGPVPVGLVTGHVAAVVWPPSEVRFVWPELSEAARARVNVGPLRK